MTLRGVVWHDKARRGVAWWGVVGRGVVWLDVLWCGMRWHGVVLRKVARGCGMVQRDGSRISTAPVCASTFAAAPCCKEKYLAVESEMGSATSVGEV